MAATERLALVFLRDHPDDAARLLERAPAPDVASVLGSLSAAEGAEVFRHMGPTAAHECAAAMDDAAFAAIVEELPLDVAAATLRREPSARRTLVLDAVSSERRERLAAALAFPDNSAGSLADPLVLALPEDITIGDAQRAIRAARPSTPDVYVVSRDRVLTGVLAIHDLMAARTKDLLSAVMLPNPIRLDASADIATIAVHPAWREFDALPVVDAAGRLVGGIQHRALRRLDREKAAPVVAALVGLSELYWAGIAGVIASLAPSNANAKGENRVP